MKSPICISFFHFFFLNKVGIPRRFRFYLFFFFVIFLSTFGLSTSYYGVWFIVGLLRLGIARRFVAAFYLCRSDYVKHVKILNLKISEKKG